MFIAIDLIIVAVMAAVIFKAYKRGFVSSLFGLVTAALAVLAAIMFYKELGVYINDTYVLDAVKPHITDFVEKTVIEEGGELGAEALISNLPEEFRALMDAFGIKINNIFDGLGTAPEVFAESLATELSSALSAVIAFAVIFFVAFIALSLLCYVLDIVAKLPILNGINKLFGLLLGACEATVLGFVIAKLAVAICTVHGTATGDPALAGVLDQTIVAKFLLSVCPW